MILEPYINIYMYIVTLYIYGYSVVNNEVQLDSYGKKFGF